MRLLFTLLVVSLSFGSSQAQLNVELLSNVPYDSAGNDVWGWWDDNGNEYAIMGTFNGVGVVNITDPSNPEEVDFIDQQGSTWRDIKTWGDYAYIVADQGGTSDGILVIDMSHLPDSIVWENVNPVLPNGDVINRCHNLYIEQGVVYLAGCNSNSGGLILFDVDTDPGNPIYMSNGAPVYSHDIYVRGDLAYSSEINAGQFAIYDVSDKQNIQLINTQTTTAEFTHNAWLSDDGNILFTTDERGNAPVGSFDVSDPFNIVHLDDFRPIETLGTGVIPHNTHVWNDWLIVSYYTDGCILVDAARPDNLIEVGNFDTYIQGGQGFQGAWGAYPFFPSGMIIVGDINAGLFVLGPTYVRACYLEGTVCDAGNGLPINGATIVIEGINFEELSNAQGNYKTGTGIPGTYTVTVSALGYNSETRMVELENGVLTVENFKLEANTARINISGSVTEVGTGMPIPGAQVLIESTDQTVSLVSGADGSFGIQNLFTGNYSIVVGSWGHQYALLDNMDLDDTNGPDHSFNFELDPGYQDIFSLDLGWETELDGFMGEWERGVPLGSSPPGGGILIGPDTDSDDLGDQAYVTGNATDFFDGLLFGTTTLTSPKFDVSSMDNPTISFNSWIWASDQTGNPTGEEMILAVDNGIEQVIIGTVGLEEVEQPVWKDSMEITLADKIDITPNMQLIVSIANNSFNSAVEAGFDNFSIIEGEISGTKDIIAEEGFSVFPNPSSESYTVDIPKSMQLNSVLNVYDLNGRLVLRKSLKGSTQISIGENLDTGVYFMQIENNEQLTQTIKVFKI